MANLKGTFLSDDNIRRMCPAEHLPPLGKTYALFGTPNQPNRLGQAPTDPKSRFLSVSQLTGIPYKSLAEEYKEKIKQIPRSSISVVSMNLEGAGDFKKRVGFMVSRGLMIPAGSQGSGTQQVGGSNVKTFAQKPLVTSFKTYTDAKDQRLILRQLQKDAEQGGFIFNKQSVTQINQMNEKQRINHILHINVESGGAYSDLDASDFLPRPPI